MGQQMQRGGTSAPLEIPPPNVVTFPPNGGGGLHHTIVASRAPTTC